MRKTTRIGLKERHSTPLAVPASAESFNATRPKYPKQDEKVSMSNLHSRSGYYSRKGGRLSASKSLVGLYQNNHIFKGGMQRFPTESVELGVPSLP